MNVETLNQDQLKTNICNHRHWIRLIYMLLFAVLLNIAGLVMSTVCVLQFIFVIATGRDNLNLRGLGGALGRYIHQTLDFLSFNSYAKPFPFSPWPSGDSSKTVEDSLKPAEDSLKTVEDSLKTVEDSSKRVAD
jgi:hypothetical protein